LKGRRKEGRERKTFGVLRKSEREKVSEVLLFLLHPLSSADEGRRDDMLM
jgi:hypothetical protein